MSFTRRELLQASSVLLGAALVPRVARAEQQIRIAVGRFTDPLRITGDGLVVRGGEGSVMAEGGPVTLSFDGRGMSLLGRAIPHDLLRVTAPELLEVRGHSYRRTLEVSWRLHQGKPELLVVHPLPLETYVLGVVSSELPKVWPLEGLKVQAVAARTYAVWQKYRRLELPYHMESTVLDQVYHGAEREHPDARTSVEQTWGQVLTHGRRPINAYFHSACGGHTESAEEGWGNALAYLPGSKCGYCKAARLYEWRAEISGGEMDKAFAQVLGEKLDEVRVLSTTRTGRVKQLELRGANKNARITGGDLRRLVGYSKIWSTYLTRLERSGGGFLFEGRGAGHGVGMCQWGARGMAEAGIDAKTILSAYYPGARLSPLY
jgi:stage II sporulation protein D